MSKEELEKESAELEKEIHRLEKRRTEIAKKLMEKEGKIKRKVSSVDRYEEFKNKVKGILEEARKPLTWTEIKERAGFTQKFPNNVWVRNMEKDIGLVREKIKGRVYWRLK